MTLAPTQHVGVTATSVQRRGGTIERKRLDPADAAHNAAVIAKRPQEVLDLVTGEKSVFGRPRHRPGAAPRARRRCGRLPERVRDGDGLTGPGGPATESTDPLTGEVSAARYTTHEMLALETGMAQAAGRMQVSYRHQVEKGHVADAIAAQDAAIRASTGEASAGLSQEQREAVQHVTGPERIAAVAGFAGAGKSTMLAARESGLGGSGLPGARCGAGGQGGGGVEESSGIAQPYPGLVGSRLAQRARAAREWRRSGDRRGRDGRLAPTRPVRR